MESGIELIAKERKEQIEKHGRTITLDVKYNNTGQLKVAAAKLISLNSSDRYNNPPLGWDIKIWNKMADKSLEERLVIAGALICAELDRLNSNK